MSVWKSSFELISKELEMANKKRQVLKDFLAAGRISQSTYESLDKEIDETVSDLEAHQKSVIEKMSARAEKLEKQIGSLELFLTNLEIHHVAGEVAAEIYSNQNAAITLGLEATKKEMEDLRSALVKVVPTAKTPEAPQEPPLEVKAPEPVPESAPTPVVEEKTTQETLVESIHTEESTPIEPVKVVEPESPSLPVPQAETPQP